MSQNDFSLANQGFPQMRADMNSAFQALASNSSGATAPGTTYAYQFWYDTATNLLKMRNADNNDWITLAAFDQTTDEWEIRSAVIQAVDSAGVVIKTDDGTTRVTVADDGTVSIANDLSIADKIVHTGDTNTAIRFPAADTVTVETAGTERVRVDSSGKLGIGTSSPQTNIEVSSASSSSVLRLSNLTQSGAGDPAYDFGAIEFFTGDTSGIGARVAAKISAEAETSSSAPGGELVFYSAAVNSNISEHMRLDALGSLTIGATSSIGGAASELNVVNASGSSTQIRIRHSSASAGRHWRYGADSSNTVYIINQDSAGVYIPNGNTAWTGLSDERYKDIIEPISNAIEKVTSLRAVIGKFKTDEDGKRRVFLFAQDVQAVLPEAVDSSNPEKLGLAPTDLIPLLVAAIKEQQTEIEQLKSNMAALEALEARVAALEAS